MRAAGRVGAALLLALAPVLLPSTAAAAEPCVGIVIDARLLGGELTTACAEGDPDSGLQAMTRAGIGYRFLPRQPGLVCQIGGSPDCAQTTGTTYWSYWHRAKGSSTWTYSSVGAASHDPAPGSTEAWVWQDGGRRPPPDIALRAICPQAFAASSGSKASTASAAPSAGAEKDTAARTSTSPRPATRAPTSRPAGSTTGTMPATTEAESLVTPAPTPSAAATRSAQRPGAPDDSSRGSWAGVATGSALVALFGGAAVARHRRLGGGQ